MTPDVLRNRRAGFGREFLIAEVLKTWKETGLAAQSLRRVHRPILLGALVAVAIAIDVWAQGPAPEELPPPPAIAAADIPARTAAEAASLRAAATLLEESTSLDEIEATLAERRGAIAQGLAGLGPALRATTSLDGFAELEWEWRESARQLESWADRLRSQTEVLDQQLQRLEISADVWERSARAARDEQAPVDIVSLAEGTGEDVRKARDELEGLRERALGLLGQVAFAAEAVAEARGRIESERKDLRSQLFQRERAPLWSESVRGASPREVASNVRREFSRVYSDVAAVVRDEPERVGFQLFVLVLVAALLRRVGRRVASEPGATPSATAVLLTRHHSLALLLTLLATPWIYVSTPPAFSDFVGILLLIPVLRVVLPLVDGALRPAVLALGALYLTDQLRDLIEGAPLAASLLFLVEMVAAAGIAALTIRALGIADLRAARGEDLRRAALGLLLRGGLLLVGLAGLATIAGFARLGAVLGGGALKSAYLAVFLLVLVHVGDVLLGLIARSRLARTVRFLGARVEILMRRGRRLLQAAAIVVWALITLDFFTLLEPLLAAARVTLFAELSIGAISLSLADLLAFGLTIIAAVLLSRFVTLVLEEDVYPRVRIGRGVAYAMSTVVRYGVVLLGFLVAVGAMGLGMDRITVLLGAFGVGLGFGLQNVVNNFVSGLILVFERPVEVGDSVEVGSVKGNITRIGIRSSTVRTFDGADVTVPNGTLLAEALTNWTLSDLIRRIEVSVGVAYGTDPDEVIAALREAEADQQGLVDEPAPQVIFQGFGESSLEFVLRAWVENNDSWVTIQSELALAVNRRLAERGIEIPFPQRDLHLRSIAPGLRGSSSAVDEIHET